jgi:hypothetical protein
MSKKRAKSKVRVSGKFLVIPTDTVKSFEDDVRDIINWIAVAKTEDEISSTVASRLRNKLEDIAHKIVHNAK